MNRQGKVLLRRHIKTIRYLRWLSLSAAAGILAGASASAFLYSLDFVTRFRISHPILLWFLPLAGLLSGWLYQRFDPSLRKGTALIFEEIHNPKKVIPLPMAPLIYFATLLTHLFGGSAGREGTAVQLGASLSDQLSYFFRVDKEQRKILLVAGAGAGFSAAIGAPWAGVLFGMEVIQVGRLKLFAVPECIVASFTAFYFAVLLATPHSIFPKVGVENFSLESFFFVLLAGMLFGLAARLFVRLTHWIEKAFAKIPWAPLRPCIGGLILVALFRLEGSGLFYGLGIDEVQHALLAPVESRLPFLKLFFSSLTVGSGFKGGEFIPLVFVGTTFGNLLSAVMPLSYSVLGALGFAAVFAGAANTPLACTVMAIEIFGAQLAPFAAIACFAAYLCSGQRGIYKSQKVHNSKLGGLVAFLLRR